MPRRTKDELSTIMLERLLELPPETKKWKEQVFLRLGDIRFLTNRKSLNSAWELAKEKAAKLHPDKFLIDEKKTLYWNDGIIRILDKKISTANFKKLNDLAEKEDCNVNAVITKLLRLHKKQK